MSLESKVRFLKIAMVAGVVALLISAIRQPRLCYQDYSPNEKFVLRFFIYPKINWSVFFAMPGDGGFKSDLNCGDPGFIELVSVSDDHVLMKTPDMRCADCVSNLGWSAESIHFDALIEQTKKSFQYSLIK